MPLPEEKFLSIRDEFHSQRTLAESPPEQSATIVAGGQSGAEETSTLVRSADAATSSPPGYPLSSLFVLPIRNWQLWIVGLWSFGCLLSAIRLLGQWLSVDLLRRSAHPLPTNSVWSERFAELVKRLYVRGSVKLLTSGSIVIPMAIGVLKPVVIVPLAMLNSLSVDQVESILLHELAHVRRHDYFVNLLQTILETVFFFHPAVWWLSAVLRDEREHLCDVIAGDASGDRAAYALALAALEEHRASQPSGLVVAADGGRPGNLLNRVQRLLGVSTPGPSRPWLMSIVTMSVLAGLFLLLTTSGADEVNGGIHPQDVRIADLALDDGSRLMCFHTDEKLIAVVVAQPPAKVRSTDMHGGVEPTRAHYHFNWDGVILNVSLSLVDIDKLMIDGNPLSLRMHRLFYWDATDRSIERRDTLRSSKIHPDPDVLKEHLEPMLPLLNRINAEFGSNETALPARFRGASLLVESGNDQRSVTGISQTYIGCPQFLGLWTTWGRPPGNPLMFPVSLAEADSRGSDHFIILPQLKVHRFQHDQRANKWQINGKGPSAVRESSEISMRSETDASGQEWFYVRVVNTTDHTLRFDERDIELATAWEPNRMYVVSPKWADVKPDFHATVVEPGEAAELKFNWGDWCRRGLWYRRGDMPDLGAWPALTTRDGKWPVKLVSPAMRNQRPVGLSDPNKWAQPHLDAESDSTVSQAHQPTDKHDHAHDDGDTLEKQIRDAIGRYDAEYWKTVNVRALIGKGQAAISPDGRYLGLVRDGEYLVIECRTGHIVVSQPVTQVASTWANDEAFVIRHQDDAEEETIVIPRQQLRIVNDSGRPIPMNSLVRASRGVPNRSRIWNASPERDGTISLAGLPAGDHWLLPQPHHELYRVSLPLNGDSVELQRKRTRAATTIQGDDISIETRSVIEEYQPVTIKVEVTNHTDQAIQISELDVHLDLNIGQQQFEVLSPHWAEAQKAEGDTDSVEVAPGATEALTLDWSQWCRDGFWTTGGTQFGLGPWPMTEPESPEHTWVRVNYLHQGAIPIALPKPLPLAKETARVELELSQGPLQEPLRNARVVIVMDDAIRRVVAASKSKQGEVFRSDLDLPIGKWAVQLDDDDRNITVTLSRKNAATKKKEPSILIPIRNGSSATFSLSPDSKPILRSILMVDSDSHAQGYMSSAFFQPGRTFFIPEQSISEPITDGTSSGVPSAGQAIQALDTDQEHPIPLSENDVLMTIRLSNTRSPFQIQVPLRKGGIVAGCTFELGRRPSASVPDQEPTPVTPQPTTDAQSLTDPADQEGTMDPVVIESPDSPVPSPPTWLKNVKFSTEEFTFVRLRCTSNRDYRGRGPWQVNYPEADTSLSVYLAKHTGLRLRDVKQLRPTDPEFANHRFAYLSGPGAVQFGEDEVLALRKYLLGGGFLLVDQCGRQESLASFTNQMKLVLPDHKSRELDLSHEIFRNVFRFGFLPQVPAYHSYHIHANRWQGKADPPPLELEPPRYFGYEDDGRLMVLVCHNNHLGDGWTRKPFPIEDYGDHYSAKQAFPFGLNAVVYALTQPRPDPVRTSALDYSKQSSRYRQSLVSADIIEAAGGTVSWSGDPSVRNVTFPSIGIVDLQNCELTDEVHAALNKIPDEDFALIIDSKVFDPQSMIKLAEIKNLSGLFLESGQVAEKLVVELQDKRPDIMVTVGLTSETELREYPRRND
ncbi:MAG: DUF4159 domain-containing protein [Planctomycetaceae bacterium]